MAGVFCCNAFTYKYMSRCEPASAHGPNNHDGTGVTEHIELAL